MTPRLGALAIVGVVVGVLAGCSGRNGGTVAPPTTQTPVPSASTSAPSQPPSTDGLVTTMPPTWTIPPGPTRPLPADGMWHFDFGMVGYPAQRVGQRTYFNMVTIGNSGSDPIRLDRITFPELARGLTITRVGMRPESDDEIVPSEAPFPANALPFDGTVTLEPTDADVPDPFTDPRFHTVFIEVEVLAEGLWRTGPMDLTYTVNGTTTTKRIANQAGEVCTGDSWDDAMCAQVSS
jgi:hypothetical protein